MDFEAQMFDEDKRSLDSRSSEKVNFAICPKLLEVVWVGMASLRMILDNKIVVDIEYRIGFLFRFPKLSPIDV